MTTKLKGAPLLNPKPRDLPAWTERQRLLAQEQVWRTKTLTATTEPQRGKCLAQWVACHDAIERNRVELRAYYPEIGDYTVPAPSLGRLKGVARCGNCAC